MATEKPSEVRHVIVHWIMITHVRIVLVAFGVIREAFGVLA
jgi:hypothetical protein